MCICMGSRSGNKKLQKDEIETQVIPFGANIDELVPREKKINAQINLFLWC